MTFKLRTFRSGYVEYSNPCHLPGGSSAGGQFCGPGAKGAAHKVDYKGPYRKVENDEYPKTVDEIKGSRFGKGYFVAPDGDLIDISNEFGGGTNDHVGTLYMDKYAKKLGLPDKDIERIKKINEKLDKLDLNDPKFDEVSSKQNELATNMMFSAF